MIRASGFAGLEAGSLPGTGGLAVIAVLVAATMAFGLLLPEIGLLPIDPALAVLAPALLVGTLAVVWSNERYWVYLAILSHLLFMVDATPDTIGLGEVAFGVIGLGGLAFWFFKEAALFRRAVVATGFDLLLVSFMTVSTLTTLLACLLHGGDLLQYAKEYGVLIDLLFFFPLRKVTRTPRDVRILLMLFVGVALVNGAISFLTYKERLAQAVFQWQLTASRSNLNESTSQALFVLAATIFAYAKRWWMKVAALALAAAGLVFLLVSFSRSPIVAAVLALMIMVSMSPWRNGRRVLSALLLALVVGAGTAFIMFPELATSVGQSLVQRVVSVAETGSDRSFKARLVESSAILNRYVAYSPAIGAGFGVPYRFLDPLTNTTISGVFVHNGYIWSLFKFGVPLALLFYVMMAYPLARLGVYSARRSEGFNRAMMAGATGYLICAFIVNFTSNLFTQVSTILNIVICWTMLDYVRRAAVERAARDRAAVERAASSGADAPGSDAPGSDAPGANTGRGFQASAAAAEGA